MEMQQIFALVGLFIAAAFLYWLGYRGGLQDGRTQATHTLHDAHTSELNEARKSLGCARYLNNRLIAHCEAIDARCSMGEPERKTLLAVASKLKLAAQTFQSLPADKSQIHSLLVLRDKTLAIADRLAPADVAEEAA